MSDSQTSVRHMIDAPRAEPFYPAELPLAELPVSRAELEELLGPPHRKSEAADDEPGPCLYWAYKFPCGLVAFIALKGNGVEFAELYADAPELDHLLRHLEFDQELRARVRKCDSEMHRKLFGELQTWNLWRQDLYGNRFLVGSHPTLRAADCQRLELEARGHKQTYWVEQETVGRQDFKLCPRCLADYRALKFDPAAKLGMSIIPFSCIIWSDEHPREGRQFCHYHPDCKSSILKLSAGRLQLWQTGAIPEQYSALWEEAKQAIPNWPGFQRLTIGERERDALKGVEEEHASTMKMFIGEGWNVQSTVDEQGLKSFKATKTWRGTLRQKVGLSRFQSREIRAARRLIALAFLIGLIATSVGTVGMARLAPSRKWPIQSGEVIDIRPGPWFLLHRRVDLRIRLREGSQEVHAIVAPYLTKRLPREVRFHYSGDPKREVFLHELENNPDWFLYIGIPLSLFFGWFLFFGNFEKSARQGS